MSEAFDSCIEQESTGENRIIPTTAGTGIDDAKGTMSSKNGERCDLLTKG